MKLIEQKKNEVTAIFTVFIFVLRLDYLQKKNVI